MNWQILREGIENNVSQFIPTGDVFVGSAADAEIIRLQLQDEQGACFAMQEISA